MTELIPDYEDEVVDEKLQHVFDGEHFRLLRAPRRRRKKRRSVVIPIEKLIVMSMSNGNGEHTTECSLLDDPILPAPISREDLLKSQKELSVLQDRLMTSLALSDTVNFEDIAEIQETVNKKTPVTLLMELAQCLRAKVNFVEVGAPEGPSHMPKFTVVAVMDGRPFARVRAGSKRDCKNGAAYLAWRSLIQEQQDSVSTRPGGVTP